MELAKKQGFVVWFKKHWYLLQGLYMHIHTLENRNGQMAGAITGSILREVFNWSQCFTIWGWSDDEGKWWELL